MEYILYYNHPEQGYGFHDSSVGFPEKHKQKVWEICNSTSEPVSGVTAVALRGEPLTDCYLLSVIFRQPEGNGVQSRGVNIVVSYLLTDQEADEAFQQPMQLLRNTESLAMEYLRQQNVRFAEGLACRDAKTTPVIGAAQLLNAASYSGSRKKQAYFALSTSALPEVATMLNLLPPKLRKKTSFHTGVQSARESVDIYANFGSPRMIESLSRSGFDGGQGDTDKYLYVFDAEGTCESRSSDKFGIQNGSRLLYVMKHIPCPNVFGPLLLDEIETWEEMERLLQLDCEDSLSVALELAPRDKLLSALQGSNIPKAELQVIQQAAERRRMQDVSQAAKTALRAFAIPEKPKTVFFGGSKVPAQEPQKPAKPVVPLQEQTKSEPYPPYIIPEGKQSVQEPSHLPGLLAFLWNVLKLVGFAGLIWFGCSLLKGILNPQLNQAGSILTVVIQLPDALNVMKLLGLLGVTVAVTVIVTVWICKRIFNPKKPQTTKDTKPE